MSYECDKNAVSTDVNLRANYLSTSAGNILLLRRNEWEFPLTLRECLSVNLVRFTPHP